MTAITSKQIPDALVAEIKMEHALARKTYEDALKHAHKCGLALIKAKEYEPHGDIETWYVKMFGLNVRTAQQYQQLARIEIDHLLLEGAQSITTGLRAARRIKAKIIGTESELQFGIESAKNHPTPIEHANETKGSFPGKAKLQHTQPTADPAPDKTTFDDPYTTEIDRLNAALPPLENAIIILVRITTGRKLGLDKDGRQILSAKIRQMAWTLDKWAKRIYPV